MTDTDDENIYREVAPELESAKGPIFVELSPEERYEAQLAGIDDIEAARRKLAGKPIYEKPVLRGLWRDQPGTPEGKYLVKRRDGSVVEWPHFVLGARDPASVEALRAYADWVIEHGNNPEFAAAVRVLAAEFELYRLTYGEGDPQAGPHRKDDPATIEEMKKGRSA